jgi:hypothetical protein
MIVGIAVGATVIIVIAGILLCIKLRQPSGTEGGEVDHMKSQQVLQGGKDEEVP